LGEGIVILVTLRTPEKKGTDDGFLKCIPVAPPREVERPVNRGELLVKARGRQHLLACLSRVE